MISPSILESVKSITAQYTAEELITKRSEVSDKMEETLTKKKRGETLGQTEITKYFQYWENMITQLRTVIGDEENHLFVGTSGETRNGLLYIGNLDAGCKFDIIMSLLNIDAAENYEDAMQQAYKEDKGEFPDLEEFAYAVGKVSIVIEK